MKSEVFLDTSYAIALSVESDQHHEQAVKLAEFLESNKTRLVTTRAILLEIGNALSKLRYRRAAVELLTALEYDSSVEIVPLTDESYQKALELFAARIDKEWGLIDCFSFLIMNERGISEALTTDEHFSQAGFIPLVKAGS
jgi:uncharacterized protein